MRHALKHREPLSWDETLSVLKNRRIVHHCMRVAHAIGHPWEQEIEQEGYIALMVVTQRIDPNRSEMQARALRRQSVLESIRRAKRRFTVMMSPIPWHPGTLKGHPFVDFLGVDLEAFESEDAVDTSLNDDLPSLREKIGEALKRLTDREAEIICLRMGLHTQTTPDGMTLEEISEILGVTRERVRQIEAKVLFKLWRYDPFIDMFRPDWPRPSPTTLKQRALELTED